MVYDPRIRAGIFAGESGGDYNALFGYQNRPDGRFSDINLTSMPISDVLAFTDPSGPYAQYVKGQVGRVATPVGAYQVVGSTLRDAVNALGIDPNTPFSPATQDRIGQWILENQGTGAWEGYSPNASPIQISTSGVNDMPITPQQPMGLLGQLGIQKQDPMATDQTALPFYQRDRFKDSMGALAMAFNELRMNPSQAIPQAVMAGRENRAAEQQNNRTVEWLRSQPNGERFAQLAEAVGAGPALQMYQEAIKPQESFQTLSGQQLIDMGMAGANPNALYKVNQATGEISQVGGAGTTINMGDQLTPFDEAAQKFQVEMYGTMAASAPNAQATLGQVDMLDTLLEQSGSGFAQGLSKFVFDTFGIDTQGSAAAAANALISQLVPAQRPQGSGTMSDADLALYRSSLPQLQQSPEGNKLIIDGMRALAQYNLATARIAGQVLNGQIDPATADQMIIDLGNPLKEVNDRIKAIGGQPAATPTAPAAPAAGDVVNGYRFKGGDPADANNWEPI